MVYNYNLLLVLKDLRVIEEEGFSLGIYLDIMDVIFVLNDLVNGYDVLKKFI
jgi:hypothetical protein